MALAPDSTTTLTSPVAPGVARGALVDAPASTDASDGARLATCPETLLRTVGVVGLGYVGLPTGLALFERGFDVIGVDVSARRLRSIRRRDVDLLERDRQRLALALESTDLELTTDIAALERADVVLICVPTPVDEQHQPDLTSLRGACAAAVATARRGQLLVLTSTTYVGTTRELLIDPLRERGFEIGTNLHVCFSPERIDPGNAGHAQESVPRVVGGATPACARVAEALFAPIASAVHVVSSPEAAELTKLYENSFRAVNISFANEMAGAAQQFGIDPIEITEAAATKPYGFMPFYPGAGVGGHCIPCDPHYLLAGLRSAGGAAPLLERAMDAIAARPEQVVRRAAQLLCDDGIALEDARVLVVGASYKPGVEDVRESPASEVISQLAGHGARVAYHDPLIRSLRLRHDLSLLSIPAPRRDEYDIAIAITLHPGHDYEWLPHFDRLLDCTYRIAPREGRALV